MDGSTIVAKGAAILACGGIALLVACGRDSDGVQTQELDADQARQALSSLRIELPDSFAARSFTKTSYFTGQPAYSGRFEGSTSVGESAANLEQLNPDVAVPVEMLCGALPEPSTWQRLGLKCTGTSLYGDFIKPNGDAISYVLNSDGDGTELFVVVSGT